MELLEIDNIKIHYLTEKGPVRAVNGVSFNVSKGEAVGLAGESGCGKTTLAYSILGLIPQPGKFVGGSIYYQGEDLVKLPEAQLRERRWKEISMVFQSAMNSLNPVMKVGDQIISAIEYHQGLSKVESRKKTEELFNKVGLSKERIDNYPFEFSGGMRQRAVIVLALSCDPKLILADEPTTALDVTMQAQILGLIQDIIREREMSLMMISHDLSTICETCDKVAIMYGGRMVEFGKVKDIYQNPIHPYTKGLINAIPSMEKGKAKAILAIPGSPPNLRDSMIGCNFRPRCPYAKPICTKESPEAINVDGRPVECFFAEEMVKISGEELYITNKQKTRRETGPGETILRIHNLKKSFPLRKGFLDSLLLKKELLLKAIDDISLNVNEAEIIGLAGESGCGKTTTAKCLVKLYEPTSGEIILNDIDITKLKKSSFKGQRRSIQMIFQDPYMSLDPRQNVYSILAEPLRLHKITVGHDDESEKVEELLSIFKLSPPQDYMYKLPSQLSGGERQRLSIARAMSLKPKIIIADEPVSMLDVSIRAEVLDLLLQLKNDYGLTIILITHDLAVASYITDRLAIMYLGEIVEIAKTEMVINNPLHPYTQALIASVPSADPLKEKRKIVVRGEPPSLINPPKGCKFHTRCTYAKPICSEKKPQLLEHEANHSVACYLYEHE